MIYDKLKHPGIKNKLQLWKVFSVQSFSERNKYMCSSSHALCYGCMQLCAFYNSFALYGGTSFVLVVLTRLSVSEPKYWLTWSLRTGINFLFLKHPSIKSKLQLWKVNIYLHSLSNFDTWILILNIIFLPILYSLFNYYYY